MGLFSKTAIGLDIGHSAIKVTGVTISRHPSIVGCAEVPIDPKLVQKEGFQDHATIAKTVREAMKAAKPHSLGVSKVYMTVPESSVFRKVLELPRDIQPAELPGAIRTASVEYLPDSLENLEVDYQLLGAMSEKFQQVMVVAVNRQLIQDYIMVCHEAKLPLAAIDTKPSSIGRAVVAPQEKKPIVLVDIGSQSTSISVWQNRLVWITGTVNIGGNILKDSATGEIDEERKPEKTLRLVRAVSDEIEQVVKYYATHTSDGAEVESVILSGGGSNIEGIEELLHKEVHLDVELAKPVVSLPSGFERQFLGSLGSALYPLYELL